MFFIILIKKNYFSLFFVFFLKNIRTCSSYSSQLKPSKNSIPDNEKKKKKKTETEHKQRPISQTEATHRQRPRSQTETKHKWNPDHNPSQNHQRTNRPNTNKAIDPHQQQTHHNQRIQTNPRSCLRRMGLFLTQLPPTMPSSRLCWPLSEMGWRQILRGTTRWSKDLLVGLKRQPLELKRLYQMQANGTLLFPAVNVNDSVTKNKVIIVFVIFV